LPQFGQNAIAAVSQPHGLQTGEQATLLRVEQAVEDQNGGFEYIGRWRADASAISGTDCAAC
jgi:hypothetical protein